MHRYIYFLCILSLLLSACAASATQPPEVTPTPVQTTIPAPTATLPEPTTTSIPLPPWETLLEQYEQDVLPFIPKLSSPSLPAGQTVAYTSGDVIQIYPVCAQDELICLVSWQWKAPISSVIQRMLYPDQPLDATQPAKWIVNYTHRRGNNLGQGPLAYDATTAELIVKLDLFVKLDGITYLTEEQVGTGGEGASSERGIVEEAVLPLAALGEQSAAVETMLETIIGYTAGVDMDRTLDPNRRLEILEWVLENGKSLDIKNAALSLIELGQTSPDMLRLLTGAILRGGAAYEADAAAIYAIQNLYPEILPEGEERDPIRLEAALKDENKEKRALAAALLYRLTLDNENKPESSQLALLSALSDEYADVRKFAARSLGRLQPTEEARSALIALAQTDENLDVRVEAINALGEYGQDTRTG